MKKEHKNKKSKSSSNEERCCMCGSPVDLSGQCINPKCRQEHTTINPLPNDELSWNEYKDYYG